MLITTTIRLLQRQTREPYRSCRQPVTDHVLAVTGRHVHARWQCLRAGPVWLMAVRAEKDVKHRKSKTLLINCSSRSFSKNAL